MWVQKQDATAIFETAWQEAAPDAPLPTDRQVRNYLGSGLPAMRDMGREREYEKSSIQAVAATLARSAGRERLLYATQDGPWNALWRLHRTYSVDGVVIMGNTAHVAQLTGLATWDIQRRVASGEMPGSRVGYTLFVPLGAVIGLSGAGQPPVKLGAMQTSRVLRGPVPFGS